MVVQHILCSRMSKREVKPAVPEVKIEEVKSEEKSEAETSDAKKEEEENEAKEEVTEEEPAPEADDKDPKDAETSEEKDNTDDAAKDEDKVDEEVTDPKQENVTDTKPQIIEVEEYFVKYRNFSYLHCEWRTEEEMYKGDKRIQAKLKRFKQKQQQNTNIFENVIIDLYLYTSQ